MLKNHQPEMNLHSQDESALLGFEYHVLQTIVTW